MTYHVQPPPIESELVDMFMGTLQGLCYKKMIETMSTGFADLVIIGERIENGMKSGNIGKPFTIQHNSKKFSNNNNPKKNETNVVTISRSSQILYYPYPYVVVVAPS